jgi:alpha-keto-acid decarboxylase
MPRRNKATTVGEYLIKALRQHGVDHVFGVPGDYILRWYELMSQSKLQHIGTTREDTSAFAADGYARCRGLGALAVTYGVGALSVVNAIAGAYAESSPVVVISGAPGMSDQRMDSLVHHRFGPFEGQREIFERITCAAETLDDPLIAARQIDRVLAAAKKFSKPVYLELPRDQVDNPITLLPREKSNTVTTSDSAALKEAIDESLALLNAAATPAVLAGVEMHRLGLQETVMKLVKRAGLPLAATLTGKSVVAERAPGYLGIYEGAMGAPETRKAIEQADLLFALGVPMTDVDMGGYTAKLDPSRMIQVNTREIAIRRHRFSNVTANDFMQGLLRKIKPSSRALPPASNGPEAPDFPSPKRAMSIARLIARLNQAITPETMVVCDTGDCLFAAIELRVHAQTEFLASAYYTTMGFAVPAALGAHIARPDRRPLVLVGDGAFQMTGTELSTAARFGLAPIVVVFNNAGYATERFILDGPFNDIASWNFHELSRVFGPMQGFAAHTEDEFERALQAALKNTRSPSLINVHLPMREPSPAMRRLAEHLRKRVLASKR